MPAKHIRPAVRRVSDLFQRWRLPLTPASAGLSLFLLSLALLWQNALSNPLHESDSALFAAMARDLAAAPVRTWMRIGPQWEWFFYEKPPLILWAEAAWMRILGPAPQAALLPTLIASHLTVWLVYKIGRRLVDREFGFLAALILCLTPWFLKLGRLPKTEPLLMFFMALALYWGMQIRGGRLYVAGTGIALALASLAKGPPALAVIPVWAVYHAMSGAMSGEDGKGKRAEIPWGRLGLALLIALAVLALADLWHYALTGSSFWKRMFAQQIAPGVLAGREQAELAKVQSSLFYLKTLLERYWPWLPFLLAGLFAPWMLPRKDPQRRPLFEAWAFGLTQAGVILLGFSAVPKKWPAYTHPYHIGLSLLTALAVYVFLRKRREIYGHLVAGSAVLAAAVFILAALFPPLFQPHPRPQLSGLIRLGEELSLRRERIGVLQLANLCNQIGHWSFRWQAQFYLNVKSISCETEPKGFQLVDLRRDRSYERDGSRVLAVAYPFAIVERRP
ncbi:MAG: glycosyltransferase family 39 protein [Candidatus Tectomicrobia bacterium]|nr:glycosyltransferase family 39 protein [Candidatus Tectomicrobia bacterium]